MPLTPNGNPSIKPRQGRSWKRARRIKILARLEAAFISDQDAAHHMQITVSAVQAIKKSPEFLAERAALASGVLSSYDSAFLQTQEQQREELDSLVPAALNAIKNVLADKNHPQYSRVAMDVLDRNKHTSKISRMAHSVEKIPDTSEQNKEAEELLALLGPGTTVAPITIEGNPQPVEILQELTTGEDNVSS